MALYGPFTATAGQVLKCTVSTDPVRLRFINTSRFDLAVAFTQAAPPAYSSGRPEYRYTVPSGDRMTVDIPFESYGSFGFPGYVFVFPVDNTTILAQTGTISGNVTFSIDTYTAGQNAPNDFASPQRVDASSQQRVIAIPVNPDVVIATNFVWSTGATHDLLTALGFAPNCTDPIWRIYEYEIFSNALGTGSSSTATYMDFSIQIQPINNAAANVGSPAVLRKGVLQGPNDHFSKVFVTPLAYDQFLAGTPGAVGGKLQILMTSGVSVPASTNLIVNMLVDIDEANNLIIPSEGGGLPGLAILNQGVHLY